MMKLNKLANWAAVCIFVVLCGCVDDSKKTIAEIEKAPDEVKERYIQTDATSVKRPPDLIRTTTLLISEVDGCKSYLVTGQANFFDNEFKTWRLEGIKTYFTKCEGETKIVSKWNVKEGKRTVEKSSETTLEK